VDLACAMARRPILSVGVCALAALSFLTRTAPSNLFTTSARAAPATGSARALRAQGIETSAAAEASSEKQTFALGPASLRMLLPATDMQKIIPLKETGASVLIGRRGDWYPFFVGKNTPQKVVLVVGEADKVRAAFTKLSEALEESKTGSRYIYNFLVPSMAGGLLIGSGGENIKRARDETGADIRLDHTPSNEDMVSISGDPQAVTAAVKWLLDAVQGEVGDEGFQRYAKFNTAYHPHGSSDHQTELDLHIPEEKIGRVIGKGGAKLARYGQDCFCRLEMNSEKQTLKITGHLGDVQMAVRHIMQELSVEFA